MTNSRELFNENKNVMNKYWTDKHGEVRELSADDLKKFRPAADVLPKASHKALRVRGKQKEPTKTQISIRLSPEVVESFKATGKGWQGRMDDALKEWLKDHPVIQV
jgi:uncharacterized protein (DUF4415 family)